MPEQERDELIYTTDDEVEFLYSLADKGKYGVLRALQATYPSRSFEGEGMKVDRKRVMHNLNFILERRSQAA